MNASAAEVRRAATEARGLVLRMLRAGGSGHLGGALSAIDIITALYFNALNVDPANPSLATRDRFILSAGHKAMAQYAVLAAAGFFPRDVLDSYGSLGSRVPGHPDMHKLPGVEANTGALGHGLPIACGMALGARMQGLGSRVFVVLGDGELPEGSNWEGASIAAHHGLDNLVAFVDANTLQISGPTADVMDMAPTADKFRAFGWSAEEIDGNDVEQFAEGRPSVIVAHTVKARGIASLEGTVASHYWKPSEEALGAAEREIEAALTGLEVSR